MRIQILKNESYNDVSKLPTKATERSTGYDIIATEEPEIVGEQNVDGTYKRIDYIQYKTNLKMSVQEDQIPNPGFNGLSLIDFDILAFPRSSISKYNLQLANSIGLIDADYRGELLLRFNYLWQPQDFSIYTHDEYDSDKKVSYIAGKPNLEKIYKKGDKICQLKVTKVEKIEFYLAEELDSTNRGNGGFGSTDKTVSKDVTEVVSPDAQKAKQQMSMIEKLYSNLTNTVETPTKKYSQFIKEREEQINSIPSEPVIKYSQIALEREKKLG